MSREEKGEIIMEIMLDKVCPNGHRYNPAIFPACPQCGARGEASVTEPIGGPSRGTGEIGATEPIGNPGGYSNRTEPVRPDYIGATEGIPVNNGSYGQASSQPLTQAPGGADEIGKTESIYFADSVSSFGTGRARSAEPVVGWMVCINGASKGEDYRLRSGYNYIGREQGDVTIPEDGTISRARHAMVAYDPQGGMFFAGPVEGRNIIRLNGKPLFAAAEIKSYDVLTVGSTELMLISLCGKEFDWTSGVKHD